MHELRKDEEERRARATARDPQSGTSRHIQAGFARALLPRRSNRVAVDATELDDRYNDTTARHDRPSEPETSEGVLGKAITDVLAGGMPNSGGPRRAVAKAAPKKTAAAMTGAAAEEEPDEDEAPKPNRKPKRRKQSVTPEPVAKAAKDWIGADADTDWTAVAKHLRKTADAQPRMGWIATLAERRAESGT